MKIFPRHIPGENDAIFCKGEGSEVFSYVVRVPVPRSNETTPLNDWCGYLSGYLRAGVWIDLKTSLDPYAESDVDWKDICDKVEISAVAFSAKGPNGPVTHEHYLIHEHQLPFRFVKSEDSLQLTINESRKMSLFGHEITLDVHGKLDRDTGFIEVSLPSAIVLGGNIEHGTLFPVGYRISERSDVGIDPSLIDQTDVSVA